MEPASLRHGLALSGLGPWGSTAEFQSLYIERLRAQLSGQDGEQAREAAGEGGFSICRLGEGSWNGLNIRPQRMHFGQESSLGVLGGSPARPRVRFALRDKPFSGDVWFHQQRLVASISLIGGRSDGAAYTFVPPCIPELNEFAARAMHHDYRGLRLERESVGVVIDAADHDIGLDALSVPALIEQIFRLGGFSAKLSGSGLITRHPVVRSKVRQRLHLAVDCISKPGRSAAAAKLLARNAFISTVPNRGSPKLWRKSGE